MEREDVVELGVASVETQGLGPLPGDEKIGDFVAGLSDD
ncbi:benenodin family lasso peptide [Sphingomonas pruni]|nr:benenodin family lasso peptide [Sphingomonas pruni]